MSRNGKMIIITINVPVSDLAYYNRLVNEFGLYPSRSEAIRTHLLRCIMEDLETGRIITEGGYSVRDRDGYLNKDGTETIEHNGTVWTISGPPGGAVR